MNDGRFDQHFLELFARGEPREAKAGGPVLVLCLVLLALITAAFLLG
ncbi:hypothetical protein [Tabrizicola sp.]|jgi:hypothetical protein|nr:hypothetical protein [Tabrizicola sp.]MBL9072967.1 hypothetical protein [Tabrizicola sp.]